MEQLDDSTCSGDSFESMLSYQSTKHRTMKILPGKEGEIMPINNKQTSKKVASKASQIMRDKRTSSKSKSVAASALTQTPGKRK